MHHFEGDDERPPSPTDSIKEIVDECADLTASYRYHTLQNDPAGAAEEEGEDPELEGFEATLTRLRETLAIPIFSPEEEHARVVAIAKRDQMW